MNINIDTHELAELANGFRQSERVIATEMQRAMKASVAIVETEVKGRTPVNVGTLRNSVAGQIRGTSFDLRGIVASSLVYTEPVERGRVPGRMPPTRPIELWASRKLGLSESEARRAAFAIALNLKAKKTEGIFMFKRGLEASQSRVIALWHDMASRLTKRLRG